MPEKMNHRVRYAVVGLGHLAQIAVLPAFANARKNSVLTALVSSNRRKLKTLAERYGVKRTFAYEDYEACLDDVDARVVFLPIVSASVEERLNRARKCRVGVDHLFQVLGRDAALDSQHEEVNVLRRGRAEELRAENPAAV